MEQDSLIHKNILDNMSDGVMTVDLQGRIMAFNPAASQLLGLVRDEVLGQVFAEVFLTVEGMDDFSQTILDAVYNAAVGHRRNVEVRVGGAVHSLALTTSYLQAVESSGENRGVIAVFSDITQIKELQAAEVRLAEALKAQHAELQDAYRKLEDNNQSLAAALKKVQVVRVVAMLFIIGLFAAAGLYTWNADLVPTVIGAATARPTPSAEAVRTVVVTPRPITSTISLSGSLAPRREVHVTSPITGKVAATHFQYGEHVTSGQRLVDLDTTEVEREHREAQAAYIKALKHFQEVEDWRNGIEVARTRRAVSKAKLALEVRKNALDETTFLLQQGVIPASEHEAAEQQYHNQQLDYESLQQGLEAVLARGNEDVRRVARLELDNARIRLRTVEDTLENAVVNAPVAGVILQPHHDGAGGEGGSAGQSATGLAKGQSVAQGERLLTIGDLDGLSVVGRVDEVDVSKIRLGHQVKISGDAFPDLRLQGAIAHVSSQASQGQGRGALPSFEVTIAIENLTAAQRQHLRLGMSAILEVVVYDKPDALLVPLNAVQTRGGKTWVRVKNKDTGAVRQIEVDAGLTTLNAVEIVRGLKAGDEVVLAGT